MKFRPFVLVILAVALLVTACGPTPVTTGPQASPIPLASTTIPDETPTPRVTVTVTATAQNIPIPPIPTPTPPIGYQEFQVENGPQIQIWNMRDENQVAEAAVPVCLILVAIDGPLPVGDTIALVIIAGVAIYYLVALPATDVGSWNPALPRIPPVDWPGLRHAAEKRFWPLMFTMLIYAAALQSPDGVFYGPVSGRIVVAAYLEGFATVALVFMAPTGLLPLQNSLDSIPQAGALVTIFIEPNTVKVRMSNCASWMIFPVIGYDPIFEPPPAGQGRCLANDNMTTP